MEASKSSEGKYLDDPDGWRVCGGGGGGGGVETWEGGREEADAGESVVGAVMMGEVEMPPWTSVPEKKHEQLHGMKCSKAKKKKRRKRWLGFLR